MLGKCTNYYIGPQNWAVLVGHVSWPYNSRRYAYFYPKIEWFFSYLQLWTIDMSGTYLSDYKSRVNFSADKWPGQEVQKVNMAENNWKLSTDR